MEFAVKDDVERSGIRVLSVHGELDLETVGELRRRLPSEFSVTAPAVIDLSECEFIDSTGLSALLRACRRAEDDGNRRLLIAARPDGQVRRLLRLTSLDRHMAVVDSREAAVNAVESAVTSPS